MNSSGPDIRTCIVPLDETVLQEAARVLADRTAVYGEPVAHWTMVAQLWSALLGVEIDGPAAVRCMIALKLARETGVHKRDNIVDIPSYAGILELFELAEAAGEDTP